MIFFILAFLSLQELSNPRQRDRLISAMRILKNSIGLLSTSMQAFLKNPGNLQTKVLIDDFGQCEDNICHSYQHFSLDMFGSV